MHSLSPSWIFEVFRKVLKGEYDEKCVELKGVVFYDANKQTVDGRNPAPPGMVKTL